MYGLYLCVWLSLPTVCASSVGTNLIYDFTAVTFSVKLVVFRENAHFR